MNWLEKQAILIEKEYAIIDPAIRNFIESQSVSSAYLKQQSLEQSKDD